MLQMRIILCRAICITPLTCLVLVRFYTLYINIKMIENIGLVQACLFCTRITYIQSSNKTSDEYVLFCPLFLFIRCFFTRTLRFCL